MVENDGPINSQSRICPGRELADSSLFIAIAMSLAVFDIRKPTDEKGVEITPTAAWEGDVVRFVYTFLINNSLKRLLFCTVILPNLTVD